MTTPLPPFGGDKLAFQILPVAPEHRAEQNAFVRVIEEARAAKRALKDSIEAEKEANLANTKKVAKVLLEQRLRRSKDSPGLNEFQRRARQKLAEREKNRLTALNPTQRAIVADIVILDDEGVIQRNKKILHDFHANLKFSGWVLDELAAAFTAEGFTVADVGQNCIEVRCKCTTPVVVGVILRGAARYRPSESNPDVLEQVGYDTPSQMARGISEADAELLRRRKQYVADKNGVPTRRFVTRAISHFHLANMLGLDYNGATRQWEQLARQHGVGQYPRGNSERVGDNVNTFDMRTAAVVDGGGLPAQHALAQRSTAQPLPHSGVPSRDATTTLGRDSPMDHNVRASTQVRNGSGSTQSMLSAAAIQPGPLETRQAKIIRGNKGERFDKSPETVAVVEIDLALVKQAGIDFVNVHSEDSHAFKVAYKRYISPRDHREKRSARAELDEFIYSGRKNREVTLDRIPNGVVSQIKPYGKPDKWEGSGLAFDKFVPLAENLDQIKTFMTAVHFENLREAAARKMAAKGDAYK